jgi:XTP/dITP diphosphohydrolase
MKLVFASNNPHKLQEVRDILTQVQVLSLQDIGFTQDIEETGLTLEQNSAIKAQAVWQWLCLHNLQHQVDGVFADDTGLEIEALNGAPGVFTARWAGEDCNDAANRLKALHELQHITLRQAQFRTVITLILHGQSQQVQGIVRGEIAQHEQGNGGFGYDPIFIPEGYQETFATLPAEVKNSISHRARALQALRSLCEA